MVTPDKDRRSYPAYALNRVKELATKEKVNYRSWRVETDVINLGYALGDVCRCIASLDAALHFDHSELPAGQTRWQDVYHCRWSNSAGEVDDLYLKLMLTQSTITVELCSFHRHR